MKFMPLIGRILLSVIFLVAAPGHFKTGSIQYAASHGVPLASALVPISGILALLGGLSILLGYKAKWGALLLILFLVPVTFMMHKFWGLNDPTAAQLQEVMFLKNLAMAGGALLISYFGSGPLSVDSWLTARRATLPERAPAPA